MQTSLPTLTRRTHPQQLHTWLTGSSLANSQVSACSQSYVHVSSRQVQGQRDGEKEEQTTGPHDSGDGPLSHNTARITSLLFPYFHGRRSKSEPYWQSQRCLGYVGCRLEVHVGAPSKLTWACSVRLDITSTGTSSAPPESVSLTCMATVSRCSDLCGALWGRAFFPAKAAKRHERGSTNIRRLKKCGRFYAKLIAKLYWPATPGGFIGRPLRGLLPGRALPGLLPPPKQAPAMVGFDL